MDLGWQLAASAPVSKSKGASWVRGEKTGSEIKRYALTFMSPWPWVNPKTFLSLSPKQRARGGSNDMML